MKTLNNMNTYPSITLGGLLVSNRLTRVTPVIHSEDQRNAESLLINIVSAVHKQINGHETFVYFCVMLMCPVCSVCGAGVIIIEYR